MARCQQAFRTATENDLGKLVEAFTQKAGYSRENIKFFSSVIAHYVADAHVPFHAALNYDGQLTGQWGLHARFESELFERFRDRLQIAPPDIAPVSDPRAFAFDALLSSYQASAAVFAADARAVAGRTEYDDGYYMALFEDLHGTLEERVARSIAAVAALVTGAWEAAGSPTLPVADPPRRVKAVRSRPKG